MKVLQVDSIGGPVFVAKHRIHHGFAGAILVLIGLVLMLDDRKDYHEWFEVRKLT